MEWQHKAANNFNGFPMRLQTLGVTRAGHPPLPTRNWLHSLLHPYSTPVSTLQLCSSCGVWMFIAIAGAREKRWSGSNANAMWMLWYCVNANECGRVSVNVLWIWVWMWMCMWTGMVSGQPEMHCFTRNFIRVFIMPSVGAVWQKEVPEMAFH